MKLVEDWMLNLKSSPQGQELLKERDQVFQFEVTDHGFFYVEIKQGGARVVDGKTDLDWKIRDWDKASYIRTDSKTLSEIFEGLTSFSEAIFDSRFGMAPRGKRDVSTWFLCILREGIKETRLVAASKYLKLVC
jgi:hypothetical protein